MLSAENSLREQWDFSKGAGNWQARSGVTLAVDRKENALQITDSSEKRGFAMSAVYPVRDQEDYEFSCQIKSMDGKTHASKVMIGLFQQGKMHRVGTLEEDAAAFHRGIQDDCAGFLYVPAECEAPVCRRFREGGGSVQEFSSYEDGSLAVRHRGDGLHHPEMLGFRVCSELKHLAENQCLVWELRSGEITYGGLHARGVGVVGVQYQKVPACTFQLGTHVRRCVGFYGGCGRFGRNTEIPAYA